jgi:hypothetical protein
MVFDIQLSTQFSKGFVVGLLLIVRNQDPWDPKSTNDALLDEIFNILFYNCCQRTTFHPFGKVVNCDH